MSAEKPACIVKELCDLKLNEIAERFGTGSYGPMGRACHAVTSRMNAHTKYRHRVGSIHLIANKMIHLVFLPFHELSEFPT
jgi:hypothetical protein